MTMVRKQVYITPEQEEKLKRLARELGVTEAEIIRQGIDLAAKESELASARPSRRIAWQALRQMMEDVARRYPEQAKSSDLPWSRADVYQEQPRPLDDAAWQEELAFIEQHAAASAQGGEQRRWSREDSYDKRRSRLPG